MRGKEGVLKKLRKISGADRIERLEANIDFTPSEITKEIDREAVIRVNEQHLFPKGRLFLCVFAFVFTAVLTFLLTQNMRTSSAASAADFKAGNLLADSVMVDYDSMTAAQIDEFLRVKCSYGSECLYAKTFDGQSAAQVIWRAAQDYRINPQVLLVLLQKEQGLVSSKATENKLRKATGYGCPDTAACDSQYYGFKNQVRNAAALYRKVMDGNSSYYPIGNNYIAYSPNASCGGTTVYIENLATSALYRYTPYQPNAAALNAGYGTGDGCSAYGNRNFVYYFTDWFGSTQNSSYTGSVYVPDGVYNITTTSGLAITFATNQQGQQAYISGNNNSQTQQYYFKRVGDYYTITNVASGLNLDITMGKSTVDSTPIQLYEDDGTCVQKWKISITDGETYKITSACSGKALDVRNGAVADSGSAVQIYTANGTIAQEWILKNTSAGTIPENTALNLTTAADMALATTNEQTVSGTDMQIGVRHSGATEQFVFERDGAGYYYIKNQASGLYLDVEGGSNNDYTPVQLHTKNTTCAQRWVARQNNDGTYTFLSACGGKALDVNSALISTNNNKVQIYTSNSTMAQKWEVETPLEPALEEGEYTIVSALGSSLVADVAGGNNKNGANLQTYGVNGTDAQNFATVTYDEKTGYYIIENPEFDRVLDVSNSSTESGANVQIWSYNDQVCAQKWIIVQDESGKYNILSSCSRLALDVTNGSTQPEANIQVYEYNNTASQQWDFVEAGATDTIQEVPNGTYQILSALNQNYALDLDTTGGWRNGSNIQLYNAGQNNNAQKFKITYNAENDRYTITNVGSGLLVDVKDGSSASGMNVWGYNANQTCAQNWSIQKGSDGYYTFKNACGGRMLDVKDGAAQPHQNVWVYKNNNTNAQKWVLKRLG